MKNKRFFYYLDELITAIQNDIAFATTKLDSDECRQYANNPFFNSD
jgi:hypothetical protein